MRLQTSNGLHIDHLVRVALDRADFMAFAMQRQRERLTIPAGTARTADTVHVIFRLHRQVEVDDVADALHVDAARGNVGGHQNLDLVALHHAQRTGTLALVHVAVQGSGGKTRVSQLISQIVRRPLGRRKHDRLLDIGVPQQVVEQTGLVAHVVGKQQRLRNIVVLVLLAGDFDPLRITHHFCGQTRHRTIQRC